MIPDRTSLLLALAAAVVFTAGAANAQALQSLVSHRADAAPGAPIGASDLNAAAFAAPYTRAGETGQAGVARTSVDHRFAPGGLVGSLGYLCGVNSFAPGASENTGPASSFGRATTYLGAKLSLTFR